VETQSRKFALSRRGGTEAKRKLAKRDDRRRRIGLDYYLNHSTMLYRSLV